VCSSDRFPLIIHRRVFEAIILIAGLQADPGVGLASMGILFTTHSLVYMVNEGLSSAAATRVSNLLGEA
jgi:Na+-driven multidrug efflux pump